MGFEHILAVKSSAVRETISENEKCFVPKKIGTGGVQRLNETFSPDDVIIGSRNWLENDKDWMQLIPYSVIMTDGNFLVYKRTKKGGEGRLSSKISIGFGGHVNMSDCIDPEDDLSPVIDLDGAVYCAAYRELYEEIENGEYLIDDVSAIGYIIDRTNEVGEVHLGILSVAYVNPDECASRGFKSKDEGIEILGFFSGEEILAMENVEEWSKIAIHAIANGSQTEIGFIEGE